MSNQAGQFEMHFSSAGHAVDKLLEDYTFEAYGVYSSPGEDEPGIPLEQGGSKKQRTQDPQRQVNTAGLSIAEPAIYAEKQAFERAVWRLLRRQYVRLCDLGEGLCLKCHEKNDQPRRRFCKECEEKVS